jgi:hypothetical protein
MGSRSHTIFAAAFLGVALYQLYLRDYIEVVLYGMAALAFFISVLTQQARFLRYKKPLVIITWVLIFMTGILFVYLIQFKFR